MNIEEAKVTIVNSLTNSKNILETESLSNWLLDVALKAKGYNNHENSDLSGENYFIRNIVKSINPKVCLDIGANIGEYAKNLLEFTDSVVIAFEPLDDPFRALIRIRESGYHKRLILENIGLGAENKNLDLYFNSKTTAHASFSADVNGVSYLNNSEVKNVRVITLDSYFENHSEYTVDFMKIDVEGFEFEVLTGSKKIISDHAPKLIQIEFNWHQLFRGHSLYSISRLLPAYTPFQLLPSGLIKRDPKEPYSNIYLFSNFVFVRNDLL